MTIVDERIWSKEAAQGALWKKLSLHNSYNAWKLVQPQRKPNNQRRLGLPWLACDSYHGGGIHHGLWYPSAVQLQWPLASGPFSLRFVASSSNVLDHSALPDTSVLGVLGPSLLVTLIHRASKYSSTLIIWTYKVKFCKYA